MKRLDVVARVEQPVRLDLYLLEELEFPSRSQIKNLIDEQLILVEGKPTKAGYKLKGGERITVFLPEPRGDELEPEPIDVEILYEDEHVVVVNKPAGMVVHPAAGVWSGTLVHALLYHCGRLSDVGAPLRPGIVHRLDRGTSGVMVVAKTNNAHYSLAEQFRQHTVIKEYRAVAHGRFLYRRGTFFSHIDRHPKHRKKMAATQGRGKEAVTNYQVLGLYPWMTYLSLHIETGRTHQIRVHLSANRTPVVGDEMYGGVRELPKSAPAKIREFVSKLDRPMLHSYSLTFAHPAGGRPMSFTADMPEDMKALLELLRPHGEPLPELEQW
ncbi:MAG TPA: RluA family pseudouridine synthase [Proteobacteria bacterium]|nr:RluA family pseudouridine synthase [Pseudomonadota bacterium]